MSKKDDLVHTVAHSYFNPADLRMDAKLGDPLPVREHPPHPGLSCRLYEAQSGVRTYRKKPVEVTAMRYDGPTSQTHAVYLWIEREIGSVDPYDKEPGVTIDPASGQMIIRTLEGDMQVSRGDWVIRGTEGEFYPCKPDAFETTYEPVGASGE